jgi:hypothetical protein
MQSSFKKKASELTARCKLTEEWFTWRLNKSDIATMFLLLPFLARERAYVLFKAFRWNLISNPSTLQWVLGVVHPGRKGAGYGTEHPHTFTSDRM